MDVFWLPLASFTSVQRLFNTRTIVKHRNLKLFCDADVEYFSVVIGFGAVSCKFQLFAAETFVIHRKATIGFNLPAEGGDLILGPRHNTEPA